MKVSEKVILFVQDKKGKENIPFKTFSTTISTKRNEEYLNMSLEVRFNVENIPQEKLNKLSSSKCYTLDVEDGWLGVREYQVENGDKRRVMYLYIDKATIKEAKDIQKPAKDNDLPF